MKVKTSELINAALDWAVGKCLDAYQGCSVDRVGRLEPFRPSESWAQGGPIIERECIFIAPTWDGENAGSSARASRTAWIEGPTPLIAAMRCYVASKLGDEVDVPEDLL